MGETTTPPAVPGPTSAAAPMTGSDRPLTPGAALTRLFLDNADHGRHAANDELVAGLRERARAIQALAGPRPPEITTLDPHLPETTAKE